ncbi:MAG: hypothetical protein CMJ78_16365 [Planctomycetaceae bacterium]|nr:hypothetical protein [Planctomycetaceae bacterium]
MNLLAIASKSIRQRSLASSLTALSVALGVTLMVTVLVIHGVVQEMFSQSSAGYDLIVGAKGSKLQLVLNTIYRVSQPIENLPYQYYEEVKEDKRVKLAIPMALGDTTEEGGFPIVGTLPHYFAQSYSYGKKFRIRGQVMQGKWHAVIGASVARQNNWDIGTKIKLVHGGMDDHVHDEEFEVVGVLAPTGTPNDKTVFAHLSGFYLMDGHDKPMGEALDRLKLFYPEEYGNMTVQQLEEKLKMEDEASHEGETEEEHAAHAGHAHAHSLPDELKEVTAILVVMKGDTIGQQTLRSAKFSAELSEGVKAQAVNPAYEISWLMQNIVGNVRTIMIVLTAMIIVVSGISIFVSIYNSMADRRKEIAIMRALGARRQTVFSIILAESIVLCTLGGLVGFVLGHGMVFIASPIVESQSGFILDPMKFEPIELVLLPSLIALASLVGFIPGMTAYRTDVAKTLGG